MALIKYFFIALIIIGTFIAGSLGLIEGNWLNQAGNAVIFIIGFLILNLIAKIAWRILFLVLGVFFIIYLLSYFEIIEFSHNGINEAKQEILEEVNIKKGLMEK